MQPRLKGMLLAFVFHQNICYLSWEAAFQLTSPPPGRVHRITPPLLCRTRHELCNFMRSVCPFLQLVKVTLNDCATIWSVNHSSQFSTICKIALFPDRGSTWPFKGNQEWPHDNSDQVPQDLWENIIALICIMLSLSAHSFTLLYSTKCWIFLL